MAQASHRALRVGDSPVVSRNATPFSFLSAPPRSDTGKRKGFRGEMGASHPIPRVLQRPQANDCESHWGHCEEEEPRSHPEILLLGLRVA